MPFKSINRYAFLRILLLFSHSLKSITQLCRETLKNKLQNCCLQLVTLLYPRGELLVTRQQTLLSGGNYHLKESVYTRLKVALIFPIFFFPLNFSQQF
jgi:phosphoserine phosphatase